MVGRRTPATLLCQQAHLLGAQLNGLNDGHVDAVHDARIATRRIRELLALAAIGTSPDGSPAIAEGCKALGRALGRVRDVDVLVALFRDLETRVPQAAPSIVVVRQAYERDRLFLMRRLIKDMEKLDVLALIGALAAPHPFALRGRLASAPWSDQLRQLLAERARTAGERIVRATGVYFPNRAHAARIAIKKLRYAAEIAQATGVAELQAAIRSARKGQDVLGHMHDRQTLADTLERYAGQAGVDRSHVTIASHVIESEILELHRGYLERRDALLRACQETAKSADQRSPDGVQALALGGAIFASGAAYAGLKRLRRQKNDAHSPPIAGTRPAVRTQAG